MSKFVNLKRNLKDDAFANHDTANTLVGTLTSLTSTKGHVLIGCTISNIHNASVTVDVALIENSSNAVTYIAKDVSIPVGGNIELISGKIVIDSDNETIHARCSVDTKADIILSVLENA
mgnify:CR=1 FL=1|tara:strand:+ start:337 stop:693 length:357 start_codon:yes stop_codon:yes gene_type:complete